MVYMNTEKEEEDDDAIKGGLGKIFALELPLTLHFYNSCPMNIVLVLFQAVGFSLAGLILPNLCSLCGHLIKFNHIK